MKNSKTRRKKKLHQTPDGTLLHMKNHGGAGEQGLFGTPHTFAVYGRK